MEGAVIFRTIETGGRGVNKGAVPVTRGPQQQKKNPEISCRGQSTHFSVDVSVQLYVCLCTCENTACKMARQEIVIDKR